MADYIRTNILCQAYVHADIDDEFFDLAVAAIRKSALPLIETRAKFFLYQDAELAFESEPGSVKSRITVFGTILVALQAVGQYKDFREGALLLYDDVRRVAEVASTETLFALKARGQEIKRIEIRTGIVGQLHRIIRAIDAAESDRLDQGVKGKAEDLEAIRAEVLKLIDNINNADDVELVADELYLLIEEIPETPTPGRRDPNGAKFIALYQDNRRKLLSSLARAKRQRMKAIHAL
ncbi:MAG: hypothetical protein K0R79_2221 [Stenotrophomonas indicatrix]|jgi:hypothetical protein|uniref:hypothetical protein n=1 Tax=Stenotrophomonas indicatrix TaxID=2045451 RepID=UPI00242F2E51|nr:hypothetical protein [Stenotrophomonas indicatrix]MDF2481864.1 hypothetical protein [Stenotrophomonas indicatrix]